ncbi:hypothetical protein D1B17_12725 [Companilactobacillus zhachilii]|uniref:Uncharacterized protein n=1 Tax=Companilactobacillus zhachilii TaxID=2304606 RepID=A0A410YDG6_9LACO|nr:hypothetical protein [Companilactobacillus zhachilii]QAV52515.1 hypothetical protein D1B17_12725 [Companilactobacillus zhachilii]
MLTISERINRIMIASIHYRNRQLLFRLCMSEHNRNKYIDSANELEAQKKSLLTAISNDTTTNTIN